jgi:hypothetical protein
MEPGKASTDEPGTPAGDGRGIPQIYLWGGCQCDVFICTNCGHTTFYAPHPLQQIASVQEAERKYAEYWERQPERRAEKKKGIFG